MSRSPALAPLLPDLSAETVSLSPVLTAGFGVLGPVTIGGAADAAVLPAGKPTTLLACLLLRPNVVVPAERLKAAVWDHHGEGNTALHTGVRRLRRLLVRHGAPADIVRAEAGGYRIVVAPDALDLTRFRGRVTAARTETDPRAELTLLRGALAEWRGPLLSNVASDVVHREEVPWLLEERLNAQERAVDVELALGRCREVLSELWELTRAHPDRERFWEQLIEALYRTGRQSEALAQYRDVKGHLRNELGVDPGHALQQLELTILRGDHLAPPATSPTPVTVSEPSRPTPPALPRPPLAAPTFVGRAPLCADLTAVLTADSGSTRTVVLSGPPGIGKTALALHVGEGVRTLFPGGQVAVRMTHPDGSPRPVDDLAAELAAGTDSDRPRLVILDDVVDADVAAHVAPDQPHDATVVTSRLSLADLAATRGGTHVRRIGLLDPAEAYAFLAVVLGDDRVAREQDAAVRLAALCDHYPLALRIASTRLLTRPLLSLEDYTTWLADSPIQRLSLGVDNRFSVSSVLGAALHRLEPELADAFLDIAQSPPGSVLGSEDVLHRLADAGLLEEEHPGHFGVHTLLRRYALSTATTRPALTAKEAR
jgi:DNA-binding SARP family transcriptional activator